MKKRVILKPKEDTTSTFSIRVDRDLVKKYDDLANLSGYSRNELISLAMKYYIEIVEFSPDGVNSIDEDQDVYTNEASSKLKKK